MKKLKIGMCGLGRFSDRFIELFQAHPLVEEVVLADLLTDRLEAAAERFKVERTCNSLDELCDTDVDAVAIFSQRQMHGPQSLQALQAGKHVYSAVPMGMTVGEIEAIVREVEKTGLLYMMGETSYYYPSTIYCRNRYQKGDFGPFVYGEAQYHHDMDHFYGSFQHSGGDQWKRIAGLPPMYYPTHSTSMILAVTGAHATEVACMGYVDNDEDEIFRVGNNNWDNIFSNETALMRTSDGGVMRINEMRRIGFAGANSVYMSFYGTEGAFEQNGLASCWLNKTKKVKPVDLTADLTCSKVSPKSSEKVVAEEFFEGVSSVHPVDRLPQEFKGHSNGHSGSHQFLVDDFVKAWASGTLPPCNAWSSARWNLPGLIAHESAKENGKMLSIPDFGDPPA